MRSQCLPDFMLGVDTSGQGNFTTLGFLRAVSVTSNLAWISVVNGRLPFNGFPELFRSTAAAKIMGECVFRDEISRDTVSSYFSNNIVMEWHIELPQVGKARGLFHIAALEAREDEEACTQFYLALQSAGELSLCRYSKVLKP